MRVRVVAILFFFFNDTATTEIYTLSLHDALPIYDVHRHAPHGQHEGGPHRHDGARAARRPQYRVPLMRLPVELFVDRKSTRLNSSHANISYAVFCLKKKQTNCSSCAFQSMTLAVP